MVARYTSNGQSSELMGARRIPEHDAAGNLTGYRVEWTGEIVPLTRTYCRRFNRELWKALRNKDLVERKRADWEKQRAELAEQRRAAAEAAARAKAEAEAQAKDSDANASEDEQPETPAQQPRRGKRGK